MDLDAPRPWVRWLDLRGLELADPMFTGTIKRALARGRQPVMSQPDALLDVASVVDDVAPAGFVFHGARAGATLLAVLARQAEDTVMLNEPSSTCMAVAHRGFTDRAPYLEALVRCLGQCRAGDQRLFVTFSSWTILRIETIQRVFPRVPCVFLYRDPYEVVGSLLDHAPKWANRPRSSLDILVDEPIIGSEHEHMPDTEFYARAIGAFDAAAARARTMRLVDYGELATLDAPRIGAWFDVAFTEADEQRMRDALPELVRREAAAEGTRPVAASTRAAVDTWALPAYAALESRRRSSSR
jgi:hypothetical protein